MQVVPEPHAEPHLPQSALVSSEVSQPLVTSPSQSSKLSLHRHWPPEQPEPLPVPAQSMTCWSKFQSLLQVSSAKLLQLYWLAGSHCAPGAPSRMYSSRKLTSAF